jgi:prepilin-type N-terminal cleavage/methylation domain-containing protein/prepilin-type processing-associated H-X9-DG protein
MSRSSNSSQWSFLEHALLHGGVMTQTSNRRSSIQCGRRAFTLVELLVVIAIIGVLVALLLPAVQAAREAARRTQCMDNIKNVALGCLTHESAKGKLPYGRKYDNWDTYTWTEAVLPYIEQQAIYNLYWTIGDETDLPSPPTAGWPTTNSKISPIGADARLRQARHSQIPVYYCPSDVTPIGNELDTQPFGLWRASYRGCVGSHDMYGNLIPADTIEIGTTPPAMVPKGAFLGSFGVRQRPDNERHKVVAPNKLREITDGTSNTLLISECVVATVPHWGGAIGSTLYGNMGGSMFSSFLTPNSSVFDKPIGPCPQDQGDTEYNLPCASLGGHPGTLNPGGQGAHAAARSRHVGGVNAAMADGSVRFFNDSVDTLAWRYFGSRERGDIPNP